MLQAGVNLANIPASMADAVASAGAWADQKLGIGDGTYQPAPRVTTQGLEQDFGLQQGALTPQTTEGKIFSEALPYLIPVGAERIAAQAPSIAGRVAQGHHACWRRTLLVHWLQTVSVIIQKHWQQT